MTWEAIIVAVSLVGMHAAWGVAYWCRRRLSEAHETCRDKLWGAEQQRDQARVQRDEAIARAEQLQEQIAEMIAQIETADKRVAASVKRAEDAERAVGRMQALRTRITEAIYEHDHFGTVEVVANTMSKGADNGLHD